MKALGLRIDVDTLRGARLGVPALCEDLEVYDIQSTIYYSVGPDNMGRNLWRLLRPAFLKKMLRSSAASLYGMDILFMGTAWPGPQIGWRTEAIMKTAQQYGHETGFHAWDHWFWQNRIDRMSRVRMHKELEMGISFLTSLFGKPPATSAVPGWRCNTMTLEEKEAFHFAYNSDCRGYAPFIPTCNGVELQTPQIPVTLPTYDEIIGSNNINHTTYNDYLLSLIKEDHPNVLTIHAEVEGIACRDLFKQFLTAAKKQQIEIIPLHQLLQRFPATQTDEIEKRTFPGREGWLACQKSWVAE